MISSSQAKLDEFFQDYVKRSLYNLVLGWLHYKYTC
jgi:hypothetical protein